MDTTDSSVNEPPDEPLYVTWDVSKLQHAEPDYVPQMQLSLDLLEASRRLHNARMAVARCQGAIDAFPSALVWRQAHQVAASEFHEAVSAYEALVDRVQWARWGLVDEAGP